MKRTRQRALTIRMKFISGNWEMLGGGQIPVKDGAEAELRVPVSQIEDRDFTERMTVKGIIPILPKGASLRVVVSTKDLRGISEGNKKHITPLRAAAPEFFMVKERFRYGAEASFLTVQIGEPTNRQLSLDELSEGGLWLVFEGAQPVEIKSSKIILPEGVADEEAISLNHAFTMLSEVYEPWRKSHTGNIYDQFFYQEEDGKWFPLSLLRDARVAKQEQKIAFGLWKRFLARSKSKPSS